MELLHPALGGTPLDGTTQLLLGVGITTICWVGVTLLTHPEGEDVLYSFIEKINPGGPGWKSVHERAAASGKKLTISKQAWNVPTGILCMLFGSLMIYSLMFSTGYFLYGDHSLALQVGGLALLSFGGLFYFWKKLRTSEG